MTPEEHNKTLGILYYVYGGLHVLITLLMIAFTIIFVAIYSIKSGEDSDVVLPMAIWTITMLFTLVLAIPSLVAGYGLRNRKPWAKLWGIIASVFAGINFPLGTALCVYSLWFLLGDAGKDIYPESQVGRRPQTRESLYGAPQPAGWTAQYARGEREHEYAPPRQPPNWRD